MGTNFYIVTKNKELVDRYFPDEDEVSESSYLPYAAFEIHIGKRSAGWKPLFESHKNAYKSISEMKEFIKKHQEDIHIYNEYNEEFTLEELQQELIDWNKDTKPTYMKHMPEGVPDEIFGGKKYLVEGTKDDYDITRPYSHVEYEALNPGGLNNKTIYDNIHYWRDEDGYEFVNRPFS